MTIIFSDYLYVLIILLLNTLQPVSYSCWENSMDYVVHCVAKSQTRLSNFHLAMLAPYVRNKIQTSFSSVQLLSRIWLLWPHGLQHARPHCPSPTPRVYSNSCPKSQWCHPTISSSAVPFSSCPQSFLASGSFQMSQFSLSGGQNIGISASTSVFPMNIQDWFL